MSVVPAKVGITPGLGKDLDMVEVVTSAGTVQREVVALGSADASTATHYAGITAAGALQTDASATVQPISDGGGSITVDGPLTDTALRAAPVLVDASGATVPVSIAGTVTVTNPSPTLATGAATSAKQDTGNTSLVSIDGKIPALSGGKVPVTDPTALPLPSGAATAAKQPALGTAGTASADVITVQGKASMTPIDVNVVSNVGAGGLTDTQLRASAVPVSNSSLPLPAGASTAAKQPAIGTAGTASADVLSVQGIASMTALKVDGSAVTQPVSITGNQAVNNAQVSGTAIDVNSGTKSAGTMRVVLATDQPALTNKLLVTPDSVALPANQSVNISQINGVTPLMGAGNTGTGSPRVTLATDQAALTNALPVTPKPGSTGGTLVATGSIQATATSIKASAAGLFGIDIFNSNTAPVYLQIWNTLVGSVTVGTTAPVMSIGIPAGAALERDFSNGIAFGTALVIAFTTTRAGGGAPTNSVDYNIEYV